MPLVPSVRASFGPNSIGSNGNVSDFVIDISPSVAGRTRYNLSREKLSISTSGEYKITPLSINSNYSPFRAKCWGAGGYGGNRGGWSDGQTAGGGGYAESVINYAFPFTVIVGQAGFAQNIANSVTVGGGHTSNPPNGGTGDMRYCGGGGGFSGLLTGLNTVHTTSNGSTNNYQSADTQSRSIIIAGGGGGGGSWSIQALDARGGAGGGGDGQGGSFNGSLRPASAGRISTNSVGTWAANGIWGPNLSTSLSSFNVPGRMCGGPGEGETYGGGGGGGYWAGACSGTRSDGAGSNMGGGGGGSGYVHPVFCISGIVQQQGSYQTPPQTGNVDYVAGRATGGSATGNTSGGSYAGGGVGTDGIVVLGPV